MRFSRSARRYAVLACSILVARALLTLAPPDTALTSQSTALSWPILLAALALGYVGLRLAQHLGLPSLSDPSVSYRRWLLHPALAGLIGALLFIVWDIIFVLPRDLNVRFPASLLFYFTGGFFVEVVQHLLPLTLLWWLVRRVWRNGSAPISYWIVALLVAAFEPATQFGSGLFSGYPPGFFLVGIVLTYLLNIIQLYFLRDAGFFAPLMMRWAFYLGWHILWGPLRLELLPFS